MSSFSLHPCTPLRPLSRPGRLAALVLTLAVAAALLGAGAPARADDADAPKPAGPYFAVASDDPAVDRLPLKSTEVEARIVGPIAEVVVTQHYRNEGQRPIEARYVFPGGTQSAVHALQVRLGERLLSAQIREKRRARIDYEAAKKEGRTSALLEQERPNVFQMNVAHILPGDDVAVELRYTELLLPTDGRYRFVFPTVVGPRYRSRQADPRQAATDGRFPASPYLHAGLPSNTRFDLRVAFAAPLPVGELRSPSHAIEVEGEGHADARVALAGRDGAPGNDRDFLLDFRLAGEALGAGLLLYPGSGAEGEGEGENFFLAMIEPPQSIAPAAITPRDYVFVVDISGSMHGYPLDTAKTLLRRLIGQLRPSDTFNVMLFAGSSRMLAEAPVPATAANVERALQTIERMGGGGSTEIVPALRRIAALPKAPDVSRSVIVVTDGYVTVENEVFALVRRELGRSNLFAFGIGTSVNRHLIEGLARAGQGEAFVVTKPEQAAEQAERLRRIVEAPLLTGVKARFEGLDAYDVEPAQLPDVLAGRPVLLFGKWRGDPGRPTTGRLLLEGRTASGDWQAVVPIGAPDPQAAALRHLWARQRIAQLSDQEALQGGDAQREAITALGLQHGLLTHYTSFIAIDRVVRGAPTPAVTVDQPQPMPAGVSDLAIGAEVPSTPEASGWIALAIVVGLLVGAAWRRGGSSARRLWRLPRRLR